MMRKKEEKDILKKNQRRNTTKLSQRKAQRDKEQAEKSEQSQKNPYSVFIRIDEEDDTEDDSVVFTEPSTSDHLPKGRSRCGVVDKPLAL